MGNEADSLLIGYSDRFSGAPGERVSFMVSTTESEYEVDVVRLLRGEDRPGAPALRADVVQGCLAGVLPGRYQQAHMGSCILVPGMRDRLADLPRLTAAVWVYPTRLTGRSQQALISTLDPSTKTGWELFLDLDSRAAFRVAGQAQQITLRHGLGLQEGKWYLVYGGYDVSEGVAVVGVDAAVGGGGSAQRVRLGTEHVGPPGDVLLIGARCRMGSSPSVFYGAAHFNGRLENPVLTPTLVEPSASAQAAEGLPYLAAWDFSANMHSAVVQDTGPHGNHGVAVNRPTRAVAGRIWTGDCLNPSCCPDQYRAMHFHDDDLEDAGWESDFSLCIPDGLASGVYAARLRSADDVDYVPFVVTPSRSSRRAPVVVVLPSLTYQAYANNRGPFEGRFSGSGLVSRRTDTRWDPKLGLLKHHPEWGKSLYDLHSDGSGWVYASSQRPQVNLRPHGCHWVTGAGRHLSADLYLLHWLDSQRFQYDVITDHEVHRMGVDSLIDYKVVLTGSHPEYCTVNMMDALQGYLGAGGNLMYLGGNGYYWVASLDPQRSHVMEVRRGNSGTRPWDSPPGEIHHSSTGEPGGLWRHRGRPPNALVGVGFTAQGWDDKAGYYERLPLSYEPAYSWIFEGVPEAERIGDFGLIMNGAAGDEIDRFDRDRGSPLDVAVLATSRGHSSHYCLAVEDILEATPHVTAETDGRVRADLVYFRTGTGGAVFSVGSMCWIGSLPVNGCRNNVSQITRNVLERFRDGPAAL